MRPRITSTQRYRAAEDWADFERASGIPDRLPFEDLRRGFALPLKSAGWRDVWIEPRIGFVAWRCVDEETSEVLHVAALKELLRWVARQVPRMLAPRNYQ